jgi:hypothetical protein
VAANDSNVYWTELGGNAKRFQLSGNTISTFYTSTNTLNAAIVLNSADVFFGVNGGSQVWVQGSLLSGAPVNSFGAMSAPTTMITSAVNATHLAIATNSGHFNAGCGGMAAIQIVPTSSSGATSVSGVCMPIQVAMDATNVYWSDSGFSLGNTAPFIEMAPIASPTSPTLVSPVQGPSGIAAYNGSLYWADSVAGQIMVSANPAAGASSAKVLATSPAPGALAADASGVYWIDGSTIRWAALTASGAAGKIIASTQSAVAIATNTKSVFWVNPGTSASSYADGALVQLAK